MTCESLLVKTADNRLIVFNITFKNVAEKIRLCKECENICKDIKYADFNSGMIKSAGVEFDKKNTDFVSTELAYYDYFKKPEEYSNGLKDNDYPARVKKENTIHFDDRVADSDVPEVVKNIGFKIEPIDEFYDVFYNESTGKYEVKDFKTRLATVFHAEKRMELVRNHFRFEEDDYKKLPGMIAGFEKEKATNPRLDALSYAATITNDKDRNLFYFYSDGLYNSEHRKALLAHEFKHIKNHIFLNGRALKKGAKILTVENLYKLNVEDERSAYIEQMFDCVNAYLKKGDYADFSMFDGDNMDIANKLRSLPDNEQRKRFACDVPQLLEMKWKDFERTHRKFYDVTVKQFAKNVTTVVDSGAIFGPEDTDSKEYLLLRSLYYRFKIYNPDSGKEEYSDLSSLIKGDYEVKIPDEVQKDLIEPMKKRMVERREEYDKEITKKNINPRLLEVAKRLVRDNVETSSFVNEVDDLKISRLFDDTFTEVAPFYEGGRIEDDGGRWEELRGYWKKEDGYKEIIVNKETYGFAVNDVKFCYKAENQVSVSQNAEYDHFVKIINAPGSEKNKIEFLDTLSPKQALLLYVACVNNGREMKGKIPSDISAVDRLPGIPREELDKFHSLTKPSSSAHGKPVSEMVSEFAKARSKIRSH